MNTGVDLPRQEAYGRWHAALKETGWLTSCPIQEMQIVLAKGRIIAQPVLARRSVPHYAGSAMDGFAVRAADTRQAAPQQPIFLTVVPIGADCRVGQAVPVDTGDVLPAGADSVIMLEHVTVKADRLEIDDHIGQRENRPAEVVRCHGLDQRARAEVKRCYRQAILPVLRFAQLRRCWLPGNLHRQRR